MEQKKLKKELTKNNVQIHKNASISTLSSYLDDLINNPNTLKKADLLSYWIEDYTKYLSSEDTFNPALYKSYKRGDVIKVNLGFNVGSEEGGLHYAVVIDKNNKISSPTITIVPLSSIKDGETIHENNVNLGTDLYTSLDNKIKKFTNETFKQFQSAEDIRNASDEEFLKLSLFALKEINKMVMELEKMKKGSYAIINQITTISKQRIYDPKHTKDILSGIKLSNQNMDLINEKIKKLYIW